MNLSKPEAQASLVEIENVISQTHKEIATGFTSNSLIIWVLGFSGSQFFPKIAGMPWLALIFVGFVVT